MYHSIWYTADVITCVDRTSVFMCTPHNIAAINMIYLLTLPSLFTYIYVTFIFPMEGQFQVYLQFVHSSVLRVYIYV